MDTKYIFTILIGCILMLQPVAGCSSVVGENGTFAFQRDSTTPAPISITVTPDCITESKPGFIHSMVWNDGWSMGIGGADNKIVNSIIVYICGFAHWCGVPSFAYLCAPFTWYTGGHLVLSSPSESCYMTFVGGIAAGTVRLDANEFLVVRNSAIDTGTYRGNDSFMALNASNFAAGHHRYAIEYRDMNYVVNNYQNEVIES